MRLFAGAAVAAIFVFALSGGALTSGGYSPVAQASAQTFAQNLLARLRGQKFPKGIVYSNGRIEATQVDVSSKYPGRVEEATVEEGAMVTKGQIVARLSSPELEAQLKAAQADVQKAKDALAAAEAEISTRQSALEFAKGDFERGAELIKSGNITKQTFDQRKRNFDAADSAVKSVIAQRDQATAAITAAEAQVERYQAMIADLTLTSPRDGRIQYQLAHAGEVVSAGRPIYTVLDLTDVYMTIFLPAGDAGRVQIGDEARLVLDPIPQWVVPATVTFVAADAQFTPKTVETKNEREKLMFRLKLKIDADVLTRFYKRVKTGVRGVGYARTDTTVAWPEDLQTKLPPQ